MVRGQGLGRATKTHRQVAATAAIAANVFAPGIDCLLLPVRFPSSVQPEGASAPMIPIRHGTGFRQKKRVVKSLAEVLQTIARNGGYF